MKSFILFSALAAVAAAAATGPIVGSFSVVGTICYPPDQKGEDAVTITTTSPASANQRVVMFDDEPSSFDQAIAAAGDCTKQLSFAKQLKNSAGVYNPGWSIGKGGTFSETIKITQGYKRQWWIVIINCDQKKSTGLPVTVTSVDIKDSAMAVPCSTMGQYDVSGYKWAVALMTIAIIVAVVFAVLYWKKSQLGPSGVTNTNTNHDAL
jgi:hypothetical protein